MKYSALISVCACLLLSAACSSETNTNTGNANSTSNSTNHSTVANANDQSVTASPGATPGTSEAQRRLEAYVKEFFSKPIPQKLSSKPNYQEKVAVFRKEGDNYVVIDANNPTTLSLAPYYAESGDDLRTIIVFDIENATISVIDKTIPAVVIKKKVNLSNTESEDEARYLYMVEASKVAYNVAESLRK